MKRSSKLVKAVISLVLCFTCILQPCSAMAATFTGKSYLKELIISYGKTEDEAKSWLKENGYKVFDHNINEGADDAVSTKRAVYIGYKTTSKSSDAITDMKLMNMTGNYSAEDYEKLLSDEATNIKAFLDNFVVAINEYRTNYKANQERAIAAHDMLNLMYDDDTEECLGDLFLNKVREEYTDEQYNALSEDEKSKVADMTTILMQSNSTSVLALEQIIALATDDSDSLWTDRYKKQPTYNKMVEDYMKKESVVITDAITEIAEEYDTDARAIASKISAYKEFLANYTDSKITLNSSEEEIKAYQEEKGDSALSTWYTAGTQYEFLKTLNNVAGDDDDLDGVSLLDILTDDEYDVEDDPTVIYPLVASLTKGQRACIDFLTMYQIVSIGINGDDAMKEALDDIKLKDGTEETGSIYDGVDRSIFGSEVAMTTDATELENSTGKDPTANWFDSAISHSTVVMYIAFGVSMAATVGTFIAGKVINNSYSANAVSIAKAEVAADVDRSVEDLSVAADVYTDDISVDETFQGCSDAVNGIGTTRTWANVFKWAGVATTAITLVLLGISVWDTYKDLKKYYTAEFTPIPLHMVDQGVDENNTKVYTYYNVVKCNRKEQGFTNDRTEILKTYGDINGDVGKEWVALYTTKDSSAGDPITASDLTIQYADSNIPDDCTPLSMFCQSTAENLTNKKAGYTYADKKNGIYMFYGTDDSAFVASTFSSSVYIAWAAGSLIIFGLVAYVITLGIKNKKAEKKEEEKQDD